MVTIKKFNFKLPLILLAIIIFISEDTITFGTTENKVLLIFKYSVYIMLMLTLLIITKTKSIAVDYAKYLLFIIISIFLASAINYDFRGGYLYQVCIIIISFYVTLSLEFDEFANIFNKILFVLSIISLFILLVASSASWLLSYFPVQENTSGTQFTNLYLCAVYIEKDYIRSIGIFREPGVYVIYLFIGIMFELFYFKIINIKRFVIFLLTLITTYSIVVYLVLFLASIGYFMKRTELQLRMKVIIVFSIIFVMSLSYFNSELYLRIISKLDMDSVTYGSAIARQASFIVNYDIFTQYPLFGSGLTKYVDLFESYSIAHYGLPLQASAESTNTYMSIFATYGILYGTIVVIAIVNLSKVFTKEFIPRVIIILSFMLLFANEDMRYSLFFNILIFYGLKYMSNKRHFRVSAYKLIFSQHQPKFCMHLGYNPAKSV